MSQENKRATIYFEPLLHKALRIKAAETGCSMSELVNKAVRHALAGDADDLQVFADRAGDNLVPFEEMLRELKRNGKI